MKAQLTFAIAAFATVFLCGMPVKSQADDAEIYVNDFVPETSQPMVMFTLDLRPNVLNARKCNGPECDFLREPNGTLPPTGSVSYFELLRAALLHVLEPLSGLKIGLMLSHANENCANNNLTPPTKNGCSNGGYIAMGFRSLDDPNTLPIFQSVLETLPTDKNHPFQGRELFYEFHSYLRGWDVWNAYHGFTSFGGDDNKNVTPEFSSLWEGKPSAVVHGFSIDPNEIEGAVVSDASAGHYSSFGRYRSPLSVADECSKIFTVNFLFGPSTQDAGPLQQQSQRRIRDTTGLPVNCQGVQCDFSSMIRYLNDTDHAPSVDGRQNVISYFLSPSPAHVALDYYANAGGTLAPLLLSESPEELVATLTDVFKQILSISTTFTAAALPVNSFDRSEVLSDVFLALFQPQSEVFPVNKYWWGNLKKLKLSGLDTFGANVMLVDALNYAKPIGQRESAVAADGRVRFDALTFWTNPTGIDVMEPDRDPDTNAVAGRDGRSVNRGAAGQQIPGYLASGPGLTNAAGPRMMFYDSGPGTLAPLDATADLAASLQSSIGASSADEALDLLYFLRGYTPGQDPLIPLKWSFGSSMHSRPLPVNYGARSPHTESNPLIYVAVGGNDGALRFVRNTDGFGNESGREAWSFVPTEVMGNTLRILPGGAQWPGETTVYGFDGTPTLFVDGDEDGTIIPGATAILYSGLRRGGHGYYALNISNPEVPGLQWRITPATQGSDGSYPFADLGLTFSQPRVGRVNFGEGQGGIRPVVIFGGGYDRIYDERGAIPANGVGIKGKGIYVVDGLTGELIRYLDHPLMSDSIPAPVTAVDTVGDGLVDRLYVGDLGGRIWRVDMTPAGEPNDWKVSLLANLGRHASGDPAGGPSDRRFFNAPDLVQSKYTYVDADSGEATTVPFDAVLVGSGDRENPLDKEVNGLPQNWFFMIRDRNIDVLAESVDTAYVLSDLVDVTVGTGHQLPESSAGWGLRLTAVGEKNLAPALTLANTVYFTTYLPPGSGSPAAVCGPAEGTGRVYTVSLFNANPPRNRNQVINPLDDDVAADLRWSDLKSGGIPAEVVLIPQAGRVMLPDFDMLEPPFATRWRTYWHLQEDPVQ